MATVDLGIELEKIGSMFSNLTPSQKVKFCKKYLKVYSPEDPPELLNPVFNPVPSFPQRRLEGELRISMDSIHYYEDSMSDHIRDRIERDIGHAVFDKATKFTLQHHFSSTSIGIHWEVLAKEGGDTSFLSEIARPRYSYNKYDDKRRSPMMGVQIKGSST